MPGVLFGVSGCDHDVLRGLPSSEYQCVAARALETFPRVPRVQLCEPCLFAPQLPERGVARAVTVELLSVGRCRCASALPIAAGARHEARVTPGSLLSCVLALRAKTAHGVPSLPKRGVSESSRGRALAGSVA
jgi:hypothetical protein